MAKSKTVYTCTECGGQSPKWQGQCPHCGVWNTLVETIATPAPARFQSVAGKTGTVRRLSSVDAAATPRFATGVEEFDRVLGGGLVPGGVILLGGDPGIGKSTLLLQAMAAIGATRSALYVTGEESVEHVALRAQRRARQRACIAARRSAARGVIATIGNESPKLWSVRFRRLHRGADLGTGSVAQVRECAAQLTCLAKQRGIVVISSDT